MASSSAISATVKHREAFPLVGRIFDFDCGTLYVPQRVGDAPVSGNSLASQGIPPPDSSRPLISQRGWKEKPGVDISTLSVCTRGAHSDNCDVDVSTALPQWIQRSVANGVVLPRGYIHVPSVWQPDAFHNAE